MFFWILTSFFRTGEEFSPPLPAMKEIIILIEVSTEPAVVDLRNENCQNPQKTKNEKKQRKIEKTHAKNYEKQKNEKQQQKTDKTRKRISWMFLSPSLTPVLHFTPEKRHPFPPIVLNT